MFLLVILTCFIIAPLTPFLARKKWILPLLPLLLFLYFCQWIPAISEGQKILFQWEWVPGLGINLAFQLDGLSMLFALIICGIGTFVFIYSASYLKGHPQLPRFYLFLVVFMGSMIGLVLADNVFALFIFWELTSITSYLLIGFEHENPVARQAALQALLITGLGGLALLAGFMLLGNEQGSFDISSMQAMPSGSPVYLIILILVLLGAFTKSAQAPFHFWLPGAMTAPTPISAYLHSATMVKAGVYLLMRLYPILGGTAEWHYLVTLAGTSTMLIGALLALSQTDLKRLLAFTTVSALGILVMLLGLGTSMATKAALVFLMVHSFYKGSLFMVAGIMDHETGTRDVTRLHSLMWVLPVTAVSAVAAAFSMSGFPPLLGFISKELMYEAKMQAPQAGPLIMISGIFANAANVAVAIIVGIKPFLGRKTKISHHVHEASPALWIGPLFLSMLGLLFGLSPDRLASRIIAPALNAIHAEQTAVYLKLWHGINPVFLMSLGTVLLGVLLFGMRSQVRNFASRLRSLQQITLTELFNRFVRYFPEISGKISRLLQNGYLRYYIITILLTAIGLVGGVLIAQAEFFSEIQFSSFRFYDLIPAVIIVGAIFTATFTSSRLAAVASLGIIGYGVAFYYVLYGAPDLALTQLLIETLTVILFALVIYRLPRFKKFSGFSVRIRDLIISIGAGSIVTALILKANALNLHSPISDYYLQNSLTLAYGKNVVNVILVDFRALDTMGEITVLSIAAIGVYALLKLKGK